MLRNAGGVGLLGGVWRRSKGTQDYIDAGNRDVLNLMSMDMNTHVRVPVNTSLVHSGTFGGAVCLCSR